MEAGAFCILYPTTCDSCFPVWQVGTVPVLSPVCTLGGAASHPSRWLFLQLEVACSACPAWYSADVLRTALCMSLELPLCGSLSCNPLPANCWRFPPLGFTSVTQSDLQTQPGFSFPGRQHGNSLRAVSGGNPSFALFVPRTSGLIVLHCLISSIWQIMVLHVYFLA